MLIHAGGGFLCKGSSSAPPVCSLFATATFAPAREDGAGCGRTGQGEGGRGRVREDGAGYRLPHHQPSPLPRRGSASQRRPGEPASGPHTFHATAGQSRSGRPGTRRAFPSLPAWRSLPHDHLVPGKTLLIPQGKGLCPSSQLLGQPLPKAPPSTAPGAAAEWRRLEAIQLLHSRPSPGGRGHQGLPRVIFWKHMESALTVRWGSSETYSCFTVRWRRAESFYSKLSSFFWLETQLQRHRIGVFPDFSCFSHNFFTNQEQYFAFSILMFLALQVLGWVGISKFSPFAPEKLKPPH